MRDAGHGGQHIDMAMIDAMTFSADVIVNVLDGARRTESVNGEVWRTVDGPKMLTGGLRWIWHQLSKTAGLVDPTPADARYRRQGCVASQDHHGLLVWAWRVGLRSSATFEAANLAWG